MRICVDLPLVNKSEAGLGPLLNLQHKIKHKEQTSGGGMGGAGGPHGRVARHHTTAIEKLFWFPTKPFSAFKQRGFLPKFGSTAFIAPLQLPYGQQWGQPWGFNRRSLNFHISTLTLILLLVLRAL